ncbi:MAG: diguanylate cyclase [Solirubrobacteraceae bacterium]
MLLIATLAATSGGADSPYPPYYLLTVVHCAIFQRRWHFGVVLGAAVLAFLAPFAYDPDSAPLREVALVTIPPVIAMGVAIQTIVAALGVERQRMAEREAEALRIADSDELTGVGNYRMFWRSLQNEIARARRYGGGFSLVLMDLDGFKEINDRFGHQAGDEALRRVAAALRAEVRGEDVLCRQGGDEFAVIAIGAGPDQAAELGRRLVDAVARSHRGVHPELSLSAGVATFGDPERTAEGLAGAADRALRDSKHTRWFPHEAHEASEPVLPQAPEPEPPFESGPEPAPVLAPAPVSEPVSALPVATDPEPEPAATGEDRLVLLGAFARELALAGDEHAVLQRAVARTAEAMEARTVEVWTRRPPGGHPALAARGHHSAVLSADEIPGAAALALEATASNRVTPAPGATPGETILAVPVSDAGDPRGALLIATPRGGLDSRRLLLALAAQLGRALAAAGLRAGLNEAELEDLRRLADIAAGGRADERVVELATGIARALRMSGDEVEAVGLAALLHHVGMLGVPAGLPLRPAGLSTAEQRILHEHPLIAERMLRPIPRLATVARILRCAHERFDGNGYPDGLAGEQIPMESRILHAAIAFSAMTSERPYRPPLEIPEARAELRQVAGSQLDPRVVVALIAVLDEALVRQAAAAADPAGTTV